MHARSLRVSWCFHILVNETRCPSTSARALVQDPYYEVLRQGGIKDNRSRAVIFRTSSSLHSHSPRTRTLLGSTPLSGITNGVQALVYHLPRRSRYRRECCSPPDGVLRRHRRPRLGLLRVHPRKSLTAAQHGDAPNAYVLLFLANSSPRHSSPRSS